MKVTMTMKGPVTDIYVDRKSMCNSKIEKGSDSETESENDKTATLIKTIKVPVKEDIDIHKDSEHGEEDYSVRESMWRYRNGSRGGVEGVATPFEEHLSLVICFILPKLIINKIFYEVFPLPPFDCL